MGKKFCKLFVFVLSVTMLLQLSCVVATSGKSSDIVVDVSGSASRGNSGAVIFGSVGGTLVTVGAVVVAIVIHKKKYQQTDTSSDSDLLRNKGPRGTNNYSPVVISQEAFSAAADAAFGANSKPEPPVELQNVVACELNHFVIDKSGILTGLNIGIGKSSIRRLTIPSNVKIIIACSHKNCIKNQGKNYN